MNFITYIYRLKKRINFVLDSLKKNININAPVYSFNFDEPYFHLGDELFFYPSIIWLKKNGYEIHVEGSKLQFFSDKRKCADNLWLIRTDMSVSNELNFNVWKGNKCISQDIMKNIFSIIDRKYTHHDYNSSRESLINLIKEKADKNCDGLLSENEYIVVSAELDSGYWRHSRSYYKTTDRIFENLDRALPIIIVGSNKKSYLPKNFELKPHDIDMRGMTTINQLIALLMNERVIKIYSYDTFVYHLSCLLGKEIEYYVRGQLNIEKIKKRFIPSF